MKDGWEESKKENESERYIQVKKKRQRAKAKKRLEGEKKSVQKTFNRHFCFKLYISLL